MKKDEIQNGLTTQEADIRLKKFGYNTLPEKPPPTSLAIFISQFKNPLVYVLLSAGVVTLFLKELSDTLIIFFVVIVNSTLGYLQEKKANNALRSLRSMITPTSEVVRDGIKKRIEAKIIVPGDIVDLEQGEKVPADGKIIRANRLFLEEAVLTGESMPVEKDSGDDIYMGTIISSGEAVFEVTKTGGTTEMGKIAEQIQKPDEDTPLTRQLKAFSRQLTVVVIVLTIFVFVIGLLTGMEKREIFTTSVALAVSSIPEGLLIALTVVLAVGMQKILKRKGLVKDLLSAETLGSVTTICVDKTGTLTYGKLKVIEEIGDVEQVCYQHFATPDDPVMVAARNWLKKHSVHFDKDEKDFYKDCVMVDSIPFTPQNRFYATLVKHKRKKEELFVNGAPEHLLEWSTLSDNEQKEIRDTIIEKTKEGYRVIGMAKKSFTEERKKISEHDVKGGLTWVGLLVFTDPVRKNIGDVFEKTKTAGIKTILITGDYADTARMVMNELGMKVAKDRVFLGHELEEMSDAQVAVKIKKLYENDTTPIIFARTKPQQKLKVINALKLNNEIVAMMGDGVNDAPALHKADIGVVVSEATDVAKESADLILLDSSFSTIVSAIREGRGIFDNIRKIILYLLSDSFEEIIAVVGSIILFMPLPVSAVQILWINIVSDGFPHLALTVDPKAKDIMTRPPLKPGTNLINKWMKALILIVSLSGGLIALFLFWYYLKSSAGNVTLARSIAFAALGINSLVYVFSVRTLKDPFWAENPLDNKWLNLAVFAGLVFQILPFTTEFSRSFFKIEALSIEQWIVVFLSSFIMFITIELSKVAFRHHLLEEKEY